MFAKFITDMNFLRKFIVIILLSICFIDIYSSLKAQSNHSLGDWNVLTLKGEISPRFSLFGEGHIRNESFNLKYDYFEIKGGISYAIARNLYGSIGSGIYNTYETGAFFQPPALEKEFRIWQELYLKQGYKRFNFDHRIRIEQRFIPENYQNRLKYRFGVNIPINKSQISPGSLYFAFNNELFIHQHGTLIEKNRLFAGAGYMTNVNTTFLLGCLSDTDYHYHSHSVKNYLQLTLIYNFARLVKKQA